jgi:hypothetical protein
MKSIKIRLTLLMLFICSFSFATHVIGGYIAMEHVAGFIYKIKFVSITNVGPQIQADRCTITVNFSDGDSVILNRVNGPTGSCSGTATMGLVIANGIKYNVYEGLKTFATQGSFKAWTIDPNRNDGIINIPGSVNIPFYCETFLRVFDPLIYCPVSTVDYGNFPLFKATVNNSFDSDLPLVYTEGDSITYRIDTCKTSFGNNIVGYSIPQGVSVHPSNGKFTIISPQQQGQFNFAIRTNKWRNGVLISYTILDFGMDISPSTINNVQLPITSNLILNNDSIYIGNFAITDTVKINYTNTAQYQINLYSEINNSFIAQNANSISISNLAQLERKQPYKLTIRAIDSPMTTNAARDFIFYFTIGNTDSTFCTLPLDLGGVEISKNEVLLYPNPTQNQFTITNSNNMYLQVYDILGNIVIQKKLTSTSEIINTDFLIKGIYIIKVGKFESKLIVN